MRRVIRKKMDHFAVCLCANESRREPHSKMQRLRGDMITAQGECGTQRGSIKMEFLKWRLHSRDVCSDLGPAADMGLLLLPPLGENSNTIAMLRRGAYECMRTVQKCCVAGLADRNLFVLFFSFFFHSSSL